MLSAGLLIHTVTIERPVSARDSAGEPRGSWTPLATRRARVEDVDGKESHAGPGVMAAATARVRLRWLDGVTASMRLRFGERVLEIVAPPMNPDGRKVEMVLLCAETEATE